MQKCKYVLILLMTALLFTSCSGVAMLSDSDADIYTKIHNRYSKMTSFSSEVTICVISNKTENKYNARQAWLSPDKMLTEFPDSGLKAYISENGVHLTYGDKTSDFAASEDINYLFINEFFKLYYLSQDTALSVVSHDLGTTTRLETSLPSPSARSYKLVLTINNKTLNPERLSVCDMAGNDVLYADFKSFIINDKIDESIFSY